MNRSTISLLLKIIVSTLLIGAVIRFFGIQGKDLYNAFYSADKGILAIAGLLLIVHLPIQIYKWHYLVRLRLPDVTAKQSAASFLGGMSLGLITPGRLGELGRALFFRDKPRTGLTTLAFVDKIYSFAAYAAIGVIGLVALHLEYGKSAPAIDYVLITAGIFTEVAVILLIMKPGFVHSIAEFLRRIVKKEPVSSDIAKHTFRISPINALNVFTAAALSWIIMLIQLWLFVSAFTPIEALPGMLSAAASQFVKVLLPISFGDLGVREATSVYFFSIVGVPTTAAFSAALLLFFVNVFLPAVAGFAFVPRLSLKSKSTTDESPI